MYANDNKRLYPPSGTVNTSSALVTVGYLKTAACCPAYSSIYTITAAADKTSCYCYCTTANSHIDMGVASTYPRYDTAKGIIQGQ